MSPLSQTANEQDTLRPAIANPPEDRVEPTDDHTLRRARGAGSAPTSDLVLPVSSSPGQALLYASRRYTRASDGAELVARSNVLLVSLYEGSGP